jgi:hypothetical protein
VVNVGDQRLARIQLLQPFNRFERVRINNPIPDEILPLPGLSILKKSNTQKEIYEEQITSNDAGGSD